MNQARVFLAEPPHGAPPDHVVMLHEHGDQTAWRLIPKSSLTSPAATRLYVDALERAAVPSDPSPFPPLRLFRWLP